MKKQKILFFTIIVVIIIAMLVVWQKGKTIENQNVYIHDIDVGYEYVQPDYHQKIIQDEIKSVFSTQNEGEPVALAEKEIEKIVIAFNKYSDRAIQKLTHDVSDIKETIEFVSTSGNSVVVYYANGLVYVERTDIEDGNLVSYIILDDSSELEAYFREKIEI
ncbi:MAG: hypothetical protein WAM95_20220 [Bacillus sp. (in: firmicutes)]